MPGPLRTTPARNTAVDTIRLVGLVGICVVNLPFIALPGAAGLVLPDAGLDRLAMLTVETLFQAKFFLLFSFVFGWSFHLQDLAARRAGASPTRRHLRRMVALAVIGCLHGILVFPGDILVIYALLGCGLVAVRHLSAPALARLALAMLPQAALCLTVLWVSLPEAAFSQPPAGDALSRRIDEWLSTLGFLLVFQGPLAFGAFCLGLAAGKSGFFAPDHPWQHRLDRALPWLLVIGLPLNLFHAAATGGLLPAEWAFATLAGVWALAPGAPILAAAWLALILRLTRRRPLPEILVAAGRNSLSIYVLQGVLGGVTFYLVGHGSVGQARLLVVALPLAGAAILALAAWAVIAGRGPLERLLRRMSGA